MPALFASTTTTIAVFLPVLFLKDVEGQMFADLALTISIAVALSIVVAITVVPAAAGRWLGGAFEELRLRRRLAAITDRVIEWTRTRRQQLGWVGALLVAPLLLSWLLLPKLDYLPPVKRAAIDAFFSFPPGMSPEAVDREIVGKLLERMQPYMRGEKEPRLKNYYVLLWPGGGTLGARVVDEDRIGELERIVRDEVVVGIPDTRVFVNEGELFGGIGGSARSVAMHLQTTDTAALNAAAEEGRRLLEATFPGANVQSFPNADVQALELRAEPNDRRIAEVGWDRASLGTVVRALGDGAWLGEYFDGQSRLPVILRANVGETPEELAQAPLITPSGEVVPLGDLVTLQTTVAAEQIHRVDHHRTVTLTIDPPPTLSLEDMLAKIDSDILPALRDKLPADANIRLAGSADRLDTIVSTMSVNFLLALLVLFMLMAAMFQSLRDATVVVLTVPLALAGGVMGIRLLGVVTFQPLDLLTMIGFIMMIGIIVNHAILLVDRTRDALNHGHDLEEALRMALNQRLRAMVASTLTGALGALPMVVNPGPASTIYRGLAAVNVAGVIVSMVFSVVAAAEPDAAHVRAQGSERAGPRARRGRRREICMRLTSKTIGPLVAVLTLLSSAAWAQAGGEEPGVVVEVAQASVARVAPRRWVPGGVVSRNDARLATSAAGRLEYVAEVGTRVKAGERVAKLEDESVSLAVEDARAEVARIESQRANSERQVRRLEQLANNSISQTQIDEARSQLAMLTAQLQQAQVRQRSAQHDLEQTELRAPFGGIVTERLAQRGEYVATGASIAHLVDTVQIEARVQAPLALVGMVRPNMELPVKVGDRQLQAKVRTVVPVGEERSRQFELRLTLANSALSVGAPLEVGLPERDAVDALVVPRDAIAVRQDGNYLMRIRPDSTAERVAITSLATDGDLVTIRGPVSAGDVVVVRGVERLQHGQRVTIQTRDAAVRGGGGSAGAL